jgi:HSP20 family molecular chaperone IbpA
MSQYEPEAWMWEKAREMLEQADKLQRRFFQLGRPQNYRSSWEPPSDIFETDDALYIVVALPGVDPAQTEVVMKGGMLTIRGRRVLPGSCQAAQVRRLEIPHGRFERHIELPPGCYEVMQREFELGCLLLGLRKIFPSQMP